MNSTSQQLITALAAFAGGFVAGVLLAPESGEQTRSRIADEAKSQLHRLDDQLQSLEKQLGSMQDQLHAVTGEVGDRVRHAVDQVVPGIPDDAEAWKVKDGDVTRELPHMPRK